MALSLGWDAKALLLFPLGANDISCREMEQSLSQASTWECEVSLVEFVNHIQLCLSCLSYTRDALSADIDSAREFTGKESTKEQEEGVQHQHCLALYQSATSKYAAAEGRPLVPIVYGTPDMDDHISFVRSAANKAM